ncbi:MAG: hypothetical protein AAGA48_15090 [Myxococcota bacterium]
MPFVIRSHGFEYNDEFYAADGPSRTMVRRVYDKREEAEDVLDRMQREWLKSTWRLIDWLWDKPAEAQQGFVVLLHQYRTGEVVDPEERDDAFWEANLELPEDLTDDQLDELVRVGQFEFGVVMAFDGNLSDDESDSSEIDEYVTYGDSELYRLLEQYDPAPWPPEAPTPRALQGVAPGVHVAWDWVASQSPLVAVERAEARKRARMLAVSWYDPVFRALVTYTPDLGRLTELMRG